MLTNFLITVLVYSMNKYKKVANNENLLSSENNLLSAENKKSVFGFHIGKPSSGA